jgi:predicted transcriptional regulator
MKNITLNKVIKSLPVKRQKKIQAKAHNFIKNYKSLQELRKVLGITQTEIANHQGVRQVNISNLEKRTDMHISTLRKYVEALGCELEINIRISRNIIARIKSLS